MPDGPPKGGQPGFMNKKLGGIKGKWWLLGGGITAAAAYVMYSRSQAEADAEVPMMGEEPAYEYATGGYGGDSYGTSGFGPSGGGGSVSYPSPPSSGGSVDDGSGIDDGDDGEPMIITINQTTHEKTNRQWQHDAIAKLEQHGYTAHEAKKAIAEYLAGLPINRKQEGIIAAAVRLTGSPPQGAPAIQHEPDKTPRSQVSHKPKHEPKPTHKAGGKHPLPKPVPPKKRKPVLPPIKFKPRRRAS